MSLRRGDPSFRISRELQDSPLLEDHRPRFVEQFHPLRLSTAQGLNRRQLGVIQGSLHKLRAYKNAAAVMIKLVSHGVGLSQQMIERYRRLWRRIIAQPPARSIVAAGKLGAGRYVSFRPIPAGRPLDSASTLAAIGSE